MGIPTDRAELALAETGNVGVEVAAEWLFSVPDDVVERALAGVDPPTPRDGASRSADADVSRRSTPTRVPLPAVAHVACGGRHTVAATTDDGVYCWGDAQRGQCGRVGPQWAPDAPPTVRAPARVIALDGVPIAALAAGDAHTLALATDGRLLGWGEAGAGQLPGAPDSGRAAPGIVPPSFLRVAPLLVRKVGAPAAVVCAVTARGDSTSLLTRGADEKPRPPPPSLADRLAAAIDAAAADADAAAGVGARDTITTSPARADRPWPSARHLKPILAAVDAVFGSAAALSAAFGVAGDVGIDVERLEATQARILGLYSVRGAGAAPASAATAAADSIATLCATSIQSSLYKATNTLLDDLHRHARLLGTPERAAALLAAAQSPLLGDRAAASVLVPRLCNTILLAPPAARRTLVRWWAATPADLLGARVVAPLQRYLTDELAATKELTVSVMNAIKVLAAVEAANRETRALPPDAFYNELISDKLDVEDHYVAWRQTHDAPAAAAAADAGDGPFSFCSYPFLLNARAKSKLLHTEARFLMTQTVHQARIEHVQSGRGELGGAGERVVAAKPGEVEGETVAAAAAAAPAPAPGRPPRHSGTGGGLRSLWSAVWRGSAGARVADGDDGRPPTPPGGDAGASAALPPPRRTSSSAASTPRADAPARLVGGAGALPADERAVAARELTVAVARASRSADPTPTGTPSARDAALARHGSMNLPPPHASGVPGAHPDMCILRVRRCHLVDDGLSEIARQRPRDLLKPLRVHFIGEDGIDAGGVKKEFFQLLVTELLSPDYGMLVYLPESRTYWFNPASLEGDDEFMLVGLVLGLAIYNAVLLDFPLPLALYRRLLGQAPTLRDLEDMEPTLGRSLRALLDYEGPGSVEDVFCASFTAAAPGATAGGADVELAPGGAAIPVTEDNRRAYVDAYVNHYLDASVTAQFEAFARGFATLCGGPAIALFSATELERLVCGSPVLDFDALRAAARYDGGFTAESRAAVWLWETVAELTPEESRRFLKFFTGSDRAPIGGLGALRCVVQRDGPHSAKLPTSHTCFNTLLLPDYASKADLGDRLRLAIMNSEGFGLE